MKVDDEDPVVTCGFANFVPSYKKSKPLIEVDDKTLFHYTDDKNDESNLDSQFFYEVKVSFPAKIPKRISRVPNHVLISSTSRIIVKIVMLT